MPIVDGVYTPLTFEDALAEIIDNAPASIKFAPGNPPELILANMFAQAAVLADQDIGATLAALMSPVGALIDLQNPNNPRRAVTKTTGYLQLQNYTGAAIIVNANTIFTASSGQTYTIGTTTATVPAAVDEYTPGVAFCVVTAEIAGAGGNIPANRTFTAPGLDLTITNPLSWLSGADRESDALYLNRITQEKTEYGAQPASVAAETELKIYYNAARISANRSPAALTTPVPVPGNGYNAVVRVPNGTLSTALETAQIFDVLSRHFEFVNSQSTGDSRHAVLSGTVYIAGVPQNFYFTVAQEATLTFSATIYVRFAPYTAREEKISQATDFAANYIQRLMEFFSGVEGTSNITFVEDEYSDVVTPVTFAANPGTTDPISPVFSAAQVRDLAADFATLKQTPQLFYDSMPVFALELDPNVEYEAPVNMGFGEYETSFIDFLRDALFSDGSSWYDRYTFIDPAKVTITVQEI